MKRVALVGNPNCGKSTLFTALTGVYQKTNNYPGVTVEKREGIWKMHAYEEVILADLPGLYSLFPEGEDECVSYREALGLSKEKPFDLIIVLIDASNLKRNLLLLSQLQDMNLPLIVGLSMVDVAEERGIKIDKKLLSYYLKLPVSELNIIKKRGLRELENTAIQFLNSPPPLEASPHRHFFASIPNVSEVCPLVKRIRPYFPHATDYALFHRILYSNSFYSEDLARYDENLKTAIQSYAVDKSALQSKLIMERYRKINLVVADCESREKAFDKRRKTEIIDSFLLHPFWGYVILFSALLLCFQLLFTIADLPMQLIDSFFVVSKRWMIERLPNAWWSHLWADGIWSGLGGVVVFVPQIALLFGIVSIFEGSGYMARINLLMDRWTRMLGLSGKSVMVFANAFACAVPAVMSARNIENKKERLITILVTPFIACSARLPVYVTLLSVLAPKGQVLGFISIRALIMLGLYLFGMAIGGLVSLCLKWIIRRKETSAFLQELPIYRLPYPKNIARDMYNKSRAFVLGAGKIIVVVSVLIWALSYFGPSTESSFSAPTFAGMKNATMQLENSYIGRLGQWIEPAIRPLGYDWKIGIALLTSVMAREIFIGALSVIYSVEGSDNQDNLLVEKMRQEKKADGSLVYSLGTVVSLLIFYALAMQCMGTFAMVYKETKSIVYPLAQLFGMTAIAYAMAWIGYVLFS